MTERQKLYTIGTLSYTLSTLCTLFFLLLLGDLVWSMKERSVAQIVQLMFKRHGASDMINGLMMVSFPNALGLLLGPVISYKSDHCRSRWGRRIPYLLFTTPIAAGAMAGMAFSPAIGETLAARLSWSADSITLCFLGFFWALFEFATVIAGALFGALINDVVPHRFLGRFYGLFRIISLLVGIGFNYYLFGFAEVHYRILFLTIGALYLAGFLIMCLNVKEGEYPVQETEKRKSSLAAIRSYFRECFSNPYYLLVFLMLFFAVMTFAPVNSFCMFYAQSMEIPMKSYGRFLAVTYFFSLVFAYGLGALADRFHPLRIGLTMLALYGVLGMIAFFWIHDEFSFGISFIAHGVIAGSYFTATASLTQRLYPQESFAQFSSAGGLLCGLGLTLLMPMAGRFLDWIGHQYQYVYLLGSLFAFAGLGTGGIVYRRFVAFGGPSSYKAPPGIRPKMLTTSKERMQDMYRKFTLLELLIVIAIMAILVSMLLPGLNRARENARSTACVNTLKTLGFGIASYTNDNQDNLPPMCYSENAGGTPYFHQSLMGTNPLDGTDMGILASCEGDVHLHRRSEMSIDERELSVERGERLVGLLSALRGELSYFLSDGGFARRTQDHPSPLPFQKNPADRQLEQRGWKSGSDSRICPLPRRYEKLLRRRMGVSGGTAQSALQRGPCGRERLRLPSAVAGSSKRILSVQQYASGKQKLSLPGGTVR